MSPRLTQEAIAQVFTAHYFTGASDSTWDERRRPVFGDALRLLRQAGAQNVYDVGAVRGEFLAYLAERGIKGRGCDLSASAVSKAVAQVELGRLSEIRPTGYDAVTILDTLYYSADPLAELKTARDAAPYLILRLRTNRNAERHCAAGLWPAAADHLWAFTPSSTTRLLARAGYTVLRMMPGSYSVRPLALPLNALVRVAQALNAPPFGMSFVVLARASQPTQ